MSQGKITDKQREILEYIKEMILKKGYPPAVREICEAVHLKSTSSVHSHLESLEKNGYIRRDPTKPRTIEILDDDFALTRRELVNVPVIGTVAAGTPILAVRRSIALHVSVTVRRAEATVILIHFRAGFQFIFPDQHSSCHSVFPNWVHQLRVLPLIDGSSFLQFLISFS